MNRDRFLKMLTAGGIGLGILNTPFRYSRAAAPMQAGLSFPDNINNDFAVKGFHIDLRVEVMTIAALKDFAKQLSRFGINTIIMEYEASYPYQQQAVISNRYAYSRTEIKDFVSWCSSLDIRVIPLQECLGHVQYILRHNRYADLRVAPEIISQIDPLNEDAIPLFRKLITDMTSLHPSKYFHIGGDEARHLNDKKFASFNSKYGISKLYTQYMKKICQIVIELGKQPVLWADMILKYPEAVEDLPVDKIIFVDWNYGWDINQFGNIAALQKKGCEFWGAAALRSSPDNYFITRWEKHFDNIKDYIPYSRKAAYTGIVMTSWSTSGEYTYLWEGSSGREVLEMFPIRNVYPLSGFRILTAAYAESLKTNELLEPENFVINYAKKRFDLSQADGEKLWKYLSHKELLIVRGKPENGKDITTVLNDFREIKQLIDSLKPSKNQQEVEHFKLMAGIREFYLSVLEIEAIMESDAFDSKKRGALRKKLQPLLDKSVQLDNQFIALNKGYLYDAELKRLNNLRNKRLNNLRNECDSISS